MGRTSRGINKAIRRRLKGRRKINRPSANMKLEGFEAWKNLDGRLDPYLVFRVGKEALRAGAKVIVDLAASKARRKSGDLARSIKSKNIYYTNTGTLVAIIGPERRKLPSGNNPGNYAHLIEFGHLLVRGGSLRKGTGTVVGKAPAYPFMRPAFDSGKRRALRVIARVHREKLGQAISEYMSGSRVGQSDAA